MPKIISIGTAVPEFKHQQSDILNFMLESVASDEKTKKLLPILYHRSGIETRYSVFPDFSLGRGSWDFFGNNCSVPSLENRMSHYNQKALELSVKSIENCLQNTDNQSITHLITVSCTGLSAPGLDILLVERLGFQTDIIRTSVNFMGCYAAIHALKIADAFCKSDKNAKVLVVCTELCTLHFHKTNNTDSVLSSTLFADGSAACLVSSSEAEKGLEIVKFYSKIALQGQTDMAWNLSSSGFLMSLTNHVPNLIKTEINSLIINGLKDLFLKREDIDHWAIHPGGKNILEATQQALNLQKEDLDESYQILKNYGNMSSPTILFVLKEIFEASKSNENIFSVAFGPGITMESMILRKNNSSDF